MTLVTMHVTFRHGSKGGGARRPVASEGVGAIEVPKICSGMLRVTPRALQFLNVVGGTLCHLLSHQIFIF